MGMILLYIYRDNGDIGVLSVLGLWPTLDVFTYGGRLGVPFTGRGVIVNVEQVPEVGGVGYQAEGLTIVIICMYMQVSLGSSVLVRRKPYISLNDAVRNCPLYAFPFYST